MFSPCLYPSLHVVHNNDEQYVGEILPRKKKCLYHQYIDDDAQDHINSDKNFSFHYESLKKKNAINVYFISKFE